MFRDLPLYLRSLRRMKDVVPRALYTSHGPAVEDGAALISEYIEHRTARVAQVRSALPPAGGKGLTAGELTLVIYARHPKHLIGAATGNTLQALRVLRDEGAAECDAVSPDGANPYTGMAAPPRHLIGARWRSKPAAKL